MSLPSAWVDRLFAKLTVTYGQRFLGLYAGLDLTAVKDDWAAELSGYDKNPDALRHALENLPADRPPNVLEFRQLCRNVPVKASPALTHAAPADPAKVAAAMSRMTKPDSGHPRAWAWRLRERERNGAQLSKAQRDFWREALRNEMEREQAAAQEAA